MSVDGNTATGKLSVRGITNEETVKGITINKKGDDVILSGTLTFDRQKYGVKFDSGSKEAILSDDIVLNIKMMASI